MVKEILLKIDEEVYKDIKTKLRWKQIAKPKLDIDELILQGIINHIDYNQKVIIAEYKSLK